MMLRLDRWLTTLGEASRSRGKELIRAGRVAVNGAPVTDPSLSFETETSVLSLDGRPVDGRVMRHAVLHKPAGVLTAARDPKQFRPDPLLKRCAPRPELRQRFRRPSGEIIVQPGLRLAQHRAVAVLCVAQTRAEMRLARKPEPDQRIPVGGQHDLPKRGGIVCQQLHRDPSLTKL